MDYVTRQFINLAKHFRKDAHWQFNTTNRTLHRIEQSIKSIDKNTQANQERQQAPIEVVSVIREERPKECKPNPKDNGTRTRDKWRLVVEVLTLLAVVGYGYMTIRQWREMVAARHKAQEAIQTANDTLTEIRRQTNLANRPWIGIDDKVEISVNGVSKDRIDYVLKFKFMNYGTSPAVNIGYHEEPFVATLNVHKVFPQLIKKTCDIADGMVETGGLGAVFPHDHSGGGGNGEHIAPGIENVDFVNIGVCIAYQDGFSKTIHHSRYCYAAPERPPFFVLGCGTNAD